MPGRFGASGPHRKPGDGALCAREGLIRRKTGWPMGNEQPGSPGGLAQLFEEHRQELLRFLTARCGDPGNAEDLLQELWIKAAGHSGGPVANGRAYLFRMANNLVLDGARGRRRAMARDRAWMEGGGPAESALDDRPDPALPADEEIVKWQEARILERAIADLPPGAQRALRLYRIEEMSQAEVARVMGISRSGVEKHLALAMRQLRNALKDCGLLSVTASQEQRIVRDGETRMEKRT